MYQIKLTPYAQTFYHEWLLEPSATHYNMVYDQTFYGHLNPDRLCMALRRYISEHLVLNSHIQLDRDDQPCWVKNDTIYELEYVTEPTNHTSLITYVCHPFDLHEGPLYRFKLILLRKNVFHFVFVTHHLIGDGLSMEEGIFTAISRYYNDANFQAEYTIAEQTQKLMELEKQCTRRLTDHGSDYQTFWQNQLTTAECVDLTFLKPDDCLTDKAAPSGMGEHRIANEITFSCTELQMVQLTQLKYRYRITPYMYGLCVLAMLLHRYTGQHRLAISYPIAIKGGIDFVYGAQVNMNFIVYDFDAMTTIEDLISHTRNFLQQTTRGSIRYGYYPMARMVEQGADKKLLDVSFSAAHMRDTPFQFDGIEKVDISKQITIDGVEKGDLLLEQQLIDNRLKYRLRYRKHYFDEGLLSDFAKRYQRLFTDILGDISYEKAQLNVADYPLLTPQEQKAIFNTLNPNYTPYQKTSDDTVYQSFERQVSLTPDKIAIAFQDKQFAYRQLNIKTNRLAHYLRRHYAIQPNDCIALYLDRSELIVTTILAVIKAGAAYVPIDTQAPIAHCMHIMSDSSPKAILTTKSYTERLEKAIAQSRKFDHSISVLTLDNDSTQKIMVKEPNNNPEPLAKAHDLIYIIYTSGTTGKPKGVLQVHKNVVDLFDSAEQSLDFNNNDVWVLFHSYIFDFSVWEMWGALLNSAKLIIPSINCIRDTQLFYNLCYREQVTILTKTPTELYNFVDIAIKKMSHQSIKTLKYIMFGGEQCSFNTIKPWLDIYGYHKPTLVNLYGTTETTICSAYQIISCENIGEEILRINHNFHGQLLFVLDNNQRYLPIGSIGELYISGRLANGYLNQKILTQERFIDNSFLTGQESGKYTKLYKTGDLVRLLPTGKLEFIGRIDSQIKVRGHRVELAAIENTLTTYPGIQQAIVVPQDQGENLSLAAYYVAQQTLDDRLLHRHLAEHLPAYMLPRTITPITKLPLTVNGKLDRLALPKPQSSRSRNKNPVKPTNQAQGIICEAFADILSADNIGIDDDFFCSGGHSLQAIKLTQRLQKHFDIQVSDVFTYRTPRRLAQLPPSSGTIVERLQHIKECYLKQSTNKLTLTPSVQQSLERYDNRVRQLATTLNQHPLIQPPIKTVLLTGATGFLGIHLLQELLTRSDCNIIVLLRGANQQDVKRRLNERFQHYFHHPMPHNKRVEVWRTELERSDLGLPQSSYQALVDRVDSVIHAAALISASNSWDMAYSANVCSTINLLKLSQCTRQRYFHYISTISVLHSGMPTHGCELYTEDYQPTDLDSYLDHYSKTKAQAEQAVIQYREQGVRGYIHRIGNVAFSAQDSQVPINVSDNNIAGWLHCMAATHVAPQHIARIDMSPVDQMAQAIIQLAHHDNQHQNIYHLFNPHLYDLGALLEKVGGLHIDTVPLDRFIDRLLDCIIADHEHTIAPFLHHNRWLEQYGIGANPDAVRQDQTACVLNHLGFKWQPISHSILAGYLKHLGLHSSSLAKQKRIQAA